MPILRFLPGDNAPWQGTYALVGHYGEVTGFSVECEEGEQLPLVPASAEFGQLWFVHVGDAITVGKAA